jgi:hypothetical protein
VGPAPVGQADDLEAVAVLGVGFVAESLVEASGLGRKQLDTDHSWSFFSLSWFFLLILRTRQHQRVCVLVRLLTFLERGRKEGAFVVQ